MGQVCLEFLTEVLKEKQLLMTKDDCVDYETQLKVAHSDSCSSLTPGGKFGTKTRFLNVH